VVVIIADQQQISLQHPHFNANIIKGELFTERFITFVTNMVCPSLLDLRCGYLYGDSNGLRLSLAIFSVDQWKSLNRRMPTSEMLRLVALVITDVSEELSGSIIRVTRIGALGTTQAATSNRRTLRRNLVLTRATRRNNPEDTILQ
jgi:hypothetical protein